MEKLNRFVDLSERYCNGSETEIYVELEDGSIVEVFGIKPSDKNNALIISLSPNPYDYRKELMNE